MDSDKYWIESSQIVFDGVRLRKPRDHLRTGTLKDKDEVKRREV